MEGVDQAFRAYGEAKTSCSSADIEYWHQVLEYEIQVLTSLEATLMSLACTTMLKDAELKDVAYQKAHSLTDLSKYDASHATLPFDDLLDLYTHHNNHAPTTADDMPQGERDKFVEPGFRVSVS